MTTQEETGAGTTSADDDGVTVDEAQPAGRGGYEVRYGDGMSSIAEEHGFFWETIWDHPDNADIKARRADPEVLLPGDRLTIPALREKTAACDTGRVHRFRRKGVPAKIRIFLEDAEGDRIAGKPYTLTVGKRRYVGTTGGDGLVDHWVAPSARKGVLAAFTDESRSTMIGEWSLRVGFLEPPNSVRGLQARLANLGFDPGPIDGVFGPSTRAAVHRYQADAGLDPTGEMDSQTVDRLDADHAGS